MDPSDGHHLVDGCYTNNLPADVARKHFGACKVIAIDVAGASNVKYDNYGEWCSGWKIIWQKILNALYISNKKPNIPKMQEISSRLSQIMGERALEKIINEDYCLYHRVPVDMFNVTDFNHFEDIYQVGSTYAKSAFTKNYASKLENAMAEQFKMKNYQEDMGLTAVATDNQMNQNFSYGTGPGSGYNSDYQSNYTNNTRISSQPRTSILPIHSNSRMAHLQGLSEAYSGYSINSHMSKISSKREFE